MAEDDLRTAGLLVQLLDEAGCAATVHHDGQAALHAARRGGFDVLLVDWMLPVLVGHRSWRLCVPTGTRRPRYC